MPHIPVIGRNEHPAVPNELPDHRGGSVGKVDLADILDLSVEDRITLAQRIWDSVAADPGAVRLTPEQRAEIERRLEDHERDPDDVVGWDEAEARIRAQLGR
jgi:putative addiction module component (TIGR02574 family)